VTHAQCFQGGIVSRITPWVASERKSMVKAFSSEVDTGSHSNQVYADCVDLSAVENASKQSATSLGN
jgi:hypothetical protein